MIAMVLAQNPCIKSVFARYIKGILDHEPIDDDSPLGADVDGRRSHRHRPKATKTLLICCYA